MASFSIVDHAPTSGSLPFDQVQEAYIGGLRGISAVRVLVFGPSTFQGGFSDKSIHDEILDRVENAGIPVEQVTTDRTIATVEVNVTRGYCSSYTVELTVSERALLLRHLSREVDGVT